MYQQTPPLPDLTGQNGPINTLQRHGCLTEWLIFMMVVNGLLTVGITVALLTGTSGRGMSTAAIAFILMVFILNIVWAVALFRWFRWGFYGFAATTIVAFIVNISMGLPIAQSMTGFVGVCILYGLLQLGTPKAWEQLK